MTDQPLCKSVEKLLHPICHFRPMFVDEADSGDYHYETWYECAVCGHTKPLSKTVRS